MPSNECHKVIYLPDTLLYQQTVAAAVKNIGKIQATHTSPLVSSRNCVM